MKELLRKQISLLLAVVMIMSVFTIIPSATADAADTVDALTAADLKATGTSYVAFNGVSKTSSAVYAGKSAKNNSGAIQLKSGSSDTGIVTTASGGKVKSVKITVASGSNTINVYGSNTAYSAASDLYSSGNQGTLIGTLTATGTISFTDEYQYVGIRSNKNAIYLTSVEITWDDGSGSEPTEPDPTDAPTQAPTEAPTQAPTQAPSLTNVTDHITRAATGVNAGATSYSTWSDKTVSGGSKAVYAGNSAGGNSAVQLRSSNSNSGIVSTTSGGKVTKITVTWNSGTSSGRTLNIYGKSDAAYSSASDLYNSTRQGTLLGTIVCGTSTELEISGDYTYIGLRSASGAMYIDAIDITWATAQAPTVPETAAPTEAPTDPPVFTVTWVDIDGTVLETDTGVAKNSTPEYNRAEPSKEADADYSYTFIGWSPAIAPVTSDITYTALYSAAPKSLSGRIIKTNDGATFYVNGKYYDYNGNKRQFDNDYTFNEDYLDYGELDFGDLPIADVEVPSNAVFAHSVYVTGDGTEDDPFVFTPNFIYSKNSGNVSGGATVTETPTPGDGFARWSRIKVSTSDNALFLQHTGDGERNCSSGYIGIGTNTYGVTYSGAVANEYTFTGDNTTLFYLGKNSSGAYVFTESVPYSDSLGDPLPTYTVTWNNYDGEKLTSETYTEGQTPSYKGEDPARSADSDYTYTFTGWSPAISPVTSDITYTAQFEAVARPSYTITWYDGDLNPLKTETYKEGQKPSYSGATPTMTATSSARYTYNGSWMDFDTEVVYTASNLPVVTGNKTYVAQFDAINIFTVQWWDDDGATLLAERTYDSGYKPSYPNSKPTKPEDANYTYTFKGWRDTDADVLYEDGTELPRVYWDTMYQAEYTRISKNPEVTWQNYDGSTIYSENVGIGSQARYSGVTPSRPAADGYTYTFNGKWKDYMTDEVYDETLMPAVLDDVIFVAQFDRVKDEPEVMWLDYDETSILDVETYSAGDIPTYKHAAPTRPDDSDGTYNYTYEFSGWSPAPAPLTDDEIYVAQYNKYKVFTITWLDSDGSTLREDTVREGDTPSYGSSPTKPDDETYSYTFSGWSPEVAEVTGDASYTAQYTTVTLRPEVFWLNYRGTIMARKVYNAYDVPVYEGETPTKPSDAYRYTFSGWEDTYTGEFFAVGEALPALTDDVFYQAKFTSELLPTYTVTWVTHDGSENVTYREDEIPAYSGTPETYYDGSNSYVFSGWSDGTDTYPASQALPAVTGDVTYTAQYTQSKRHSFTLTWANYDGSEITHQTVKEGTVPSYPSGTAPARAADSKHSYVFSGWKDSADTAAEPAVYGAGDTMPAVTSDVTYVAVYTEGPSHVNGVVPTDDYEYYTLGGAWYIYNDGDTVEERQLDPDAYISLIEVDDDNDGEGFLYISDMTSGNDIPVDTFSTNTTYGEHAHKELTHTAYVIGTGTYDDPYEFHVNYLYYDNVHQNVCGADIIKADVRYIYPGDCFKGNSRIDLGLDEVNAATFTTYPDVIEVPDNGILGIGRNNYGYKYVKANAVESDAGFGPYNYESGKTAMYYYGLNEAGTSHLFSPEEFPERTDLVGTDAYSSGYVITWENWDGTELPYSPEVYDENDIPSYKGSTPTKDEDEYNTYVFDGWEQEIVPVTYSFTYTAKYLAIPKGFTVRWKNYDGTVLKTDVAAAGDIPSYDGAAPTKPGYSRFTYTFSGWTDGANTYGRDETLPEVTGDTEYTAVFTESSKLFVGYTLTLQGDIGINFYLDVTGDEVTQGSGVLVKFSWNVEGNIKRSEYQVKSGETMTVGDKVYYKSTCWVAAAEMAYDVHAEAYINGVLQDETDDYSVRNYGMDILNSPAGSYQKQDKLNDLVKAMIDYGAKAQVYFERKTGDLANKDVKDYSMTTISSSVIPELKSDMRSGTSVFGLEYYGSSIIYLTKTTLRHYYRVTDSSKLDSVKAAAAASGFEYGEKDGLIYFDMKNIPAAKLDEVYTITLGENASYDYSVLDYSKLVIDKSRNENEKKLAMATYWYNNAANIYFGA